MPAAAWRYLAVALTVIGSADRSSAQERDGGPPELKFRPTYGLQVRTHVAGVLAPRGRAALENVAAGLLAVAGVAIDWRDCRRPGACTGGDDSVRSITLILISAPRAACGEAQSVAGGSSATVLVSLDCVARALVEIKRLSSSRADPVLATLDSSDLLGAVVAHEIGHALGVRHAASGLMRARFGIGEVRALGEGTLGFDTTQAAEIRASVARVAPDRRWAASQMP